MTINIDLEEKDVTGGSSASERNFSPLVTMSASRSNMIKLHAEQDGQQSVRGRGQVSLVYILLRTDHYCESSLPGAT